MRYVYAVREPGRLPAVSGLDAAAIEAVGAEGLEAVCSRSAREPRPEDRDLWRHQLVVEALMAHGPVLPARFGTRLRDDGEVRAQLRRHRPALADGIARVRDRVEMGVRVLWDERPPTRAPGADGDAGSGRAYLLARAGEERAERAWKATATRLAQRLHAPIAARAAAATVRVLPRPGTLMAGAYLVAKGEEEVIEQAAAELAADHAELMVAPTGPWPPYSFAPSLPTRADGDPDREAARAR